jgi:predicted GIY-YIG superfamily endonuclease
VSEAFTLRVYVPSGDPEGARIVERMNWTGRGYFVSRDNWPEIRQRPELHAGGIYILIGYQLDQLGAELPVAYVGQTDNLRKRIDQHDAGKDFWTRCVLFVSTAGGLNRAHTTWLEWALLQQAAAAKRAHLLNSVTPAEPALIESEKADTRAFLNEMLRMLPTMGVHLFEKAKVIHSAPATPTAVSPVAVKDTIVVPAQLGGFERAYLGSNAWWAIRVAAKHRDHLKWIAAYQVAPISAVTHIAPIKQLEPFGDEGKFKVVFAEPAQPLPSPIPFGHAPQGAMQGVRYTTREALLMATSVKDLV